MKTKLTLSMLIIVVFLGLPCFAKFKDIPGSHKAAPAVQKLLEVGIIDISPDRKFRGKDPLSMYQMAVIMDKIMDKTGKKKELEMVPVEKFYINVPEKNYAYSAVMDLVKLGLFIVPESKIFAGDVKVTRATFYSYMAAFLERLRGKTLFLAPSDRGYPDLSEDRPAYPYIQKLIGEGLLGGQGKFNENMIVNRYEMAEFASKIVDYLNLKTQEKVKGSSGYIDIPEDNYARQAVDELVEAGVLEPGEGKKLNGAALLNRYYLADLIAKIIDKILMGEEKTVRPAPYALSYKDVPINSFAFGSIQKLIGSGFIPPGNRTELFYGDRKINRYQIVFFVFSAIEHMLSDVVDFQAADTSSGYRDVPRDNFAYETIQKLIWLNALGGGETKDFAGEEYVDRYELCFFAVNLVKAVIAKIGEAKEVYPQPTGYGFDVVLNTRLNMAQVSNGGGQGTDLNDINVLQQIDVSVDRRLNNYLSVFASLSSSYNFGDTAASSSPLLSQGYIIAGNSPLVLQAGRTNCYQGYTPFGDSLFINTSADMLKLDYDHQLFKLNSVVGKLIYLGDISLDSSFGMVYLTPKLPAFISWMELALGTNLIANLPDPTSTFTLPGKVLQTYGGLRISPLIDIEITAEIAKLQFSDPAALALIGSNSNEAPCATQVSLSYFSEDYGYNLSVGYKKIADGYYLSALIDPTSLLGNETNTENLLIRTRSYPSPTQIIGADLTYVMRDNFNVKTGLSGFYNLKVFESAYLNFMLSKIIDNTSAGQHELNLSSSFSITF